jgi:cyanophycinase
MSGPIALVGGEEFTGPAEAFDRELLALIDAKTPNVAILPTAAQPENSYLAAAHGIAHFRRLDADPYGVMIADRVTANAPVLVEELAGADVVYLTGGWPAHLFESLRDTLAWKRVLEMHEAGMMLAGSSAGAMVLCEVMAFEGKEISGLGLVQGVTVLPHFEKADAERIEKIANDAKQGMTYLGIDAATGCVRVGDDWRVSGPGRVHVIRKDDVHVVASGGSFSLA